MALTLKIITATVLKQRPVQSVQLSDSDKEPIAAGQELPIQWYTVEGDHLKVAFSVAKFNGMNTWYAFGSHVQVLKDGKVAYPVPLPTSVKLPIPYRSQLDNSNNPYGSCNVTSLAMCLDYLGAKRKRAGGQFEDELYRYAEDHGLSRHDPHDLAQIVRDYGCKDTFESDANFDQIKRWLATGKPIVVHGYFTSFGHIVVIAGYDQAGFLVHDPYGEWFENGYRTDLSGEYVHYSYALMKRLCMPDGGCWAHFIQ